MDIDTGDRLKPLFQIKSMLIDADAERNVNIIHYLGQRIKVKIINSPQFDQNRTLIELSNPEDMIAMAVCLDKPILIHVLQRDEQDRPSLIEEFLVSDKEIYRVEYSIDSSD